MTETTTAWGKDRPKPSTHEPQEMPRTEMFAANHGMNRSDGLPLRSLSGMTSRPAISTARPPWALPGVGAEESDIDRSYENWDPYHRA